jgi:hypothetical protein
VAVHGEQRVRGKPPDTAQVPGGDRTYQCDRVRHALRLQLEAAAARRLLSREQLPGAELMVTANVAATVDTDVDPDGWLFLAPADDQPPARRSALSAVAA